MEKRKKKKNQPMKYILFLSTCTVIARVTSFTIIPQTSLLKTNAYNNKPSSFSTNFNDRKIIVDMKKEKDERDERDWLHKEYKKVFNVVTASLFLSTSIFMNGSGSGSGSDSGIPTSYSYAATPASETAKYDGFAEYAKDNQMEQSDVGCFIKQCGDQTKALFSNPRGIKGVSCLGRCKGEQSCATRCFAEVCKFERELDYVN